MRISDWSSDVCSSDLIEKARVRFDHAAYWMERLAGTAATIRDQRRRLLWAAGGGLLAGMLLWSFLPGVLLRASRSEERRVGKECVVRVDLGGRRIIKNKRYTNKHRNSPNHRTLI